MEYKDIILPNYNHCILNTITSILKYYNIDSKHKSLESLDNILASGNYKNIVFILLDGLGEHILNNISKNGYFNKNKIDVVTSVYPSTTTAALTTYYSGMTPYETGWIAWSQYFKEYGRAIDMLSHQESYIKEPIKNPIKDVFKTDMNYHTIFEKIEKENKNVKAFEIEPQYAQRRAKRRITADNTEEIFSAIKDTVEISGEKFIFAYSDNPDGLLHKFGTDSEEVKDYVLEVENKIQELRKTTNKDTIIIISADHGHKNIENSYTILDYPEILECLITPPSMESRFLSFWVKEDMKDKFVKRFKCKFEDEFWLLTKEEFLDKYKFLGAGTKHHKIDDFIGNYVAISVAGSMIRLETFLSEGKPIKESTHCGLTKEEMEVPVIVLKEN